MKSVDVYKVSFEFMAIAIKVSDNIPGGLLRLKINLNGLLGQYPQN